MPDAFAILDSIARRALGSLPTNSYVYIEPPRRALDLGRALEELVDSWLRGIDVSVGSVIPTPAPKRIVEELSSILELVVEEIERSDIASFELAHALTRAAAALCISAGEGCRDLEPVRRARKLARAMVERSRALEGVLRRGRY